MMNIIYLQPSEFQTFSFNFKPQTYLSFYKTTKINHTTTNTHTTYLHANTYILMKYHIQFNYLGSTSRHGHSALHPAYIRGISL